MNFEDELPIDEYSRDNLGIPEKRSDINASKVLGIVSAVTSVICCFFYGIPGLVTGIIGLVIAGQAKKKYSITPRGLDQRELSDLKLAKTLSIVGIVISGLTLLFIVVYFVGVFSLAAGEIMNEF
ncbi:MAG: CCC motif membrane protein [Bacteroidota bacterium]